MKHDRALDALRTFGDGALSQGGQIVSARYEPAGPRLASLGNDHTLGVVDVRAGRRVASVAVEAGRKVLAWGAGDELLVWAMRGIVRVALGGEAGRVVVAFEPGEGFFVEDAFASDDGATVVLYEERRGHDGDVVHRRVRVLDGGDGAERLRFAIELGPVAAAAGLGELPEGATLVVHGATLASDGARLFAVASVQRLARGGREGQPDRWLEPLGGLVLAWRVADGELVAARPAPEGAAALGNQGSYLGAARVACSPDRSSFVSAGWLFDAETCEPRLARRLALVPWQSADAFAFALGGRAVFAAGDDWVALFDAATGEPIASRTFDERAFVLGVAASDVAGVAAVADDRSLQLFALPDLAPLHVAPGHTSAVRAVAIAPGGGRVVSSDSSSLIGWCARTGERLFRRPTPAWPLLAFGPDAERFVAPMNGQRLHVVDARTGEASEAPDDARVTALAFGDDGRVVSIDYAEDVSPGAAGAQIFVYEGLEARLVATLASPPLRCVPALSADGRRALLHDDMIAYGWCLERRAELWRREMGVYHAALSPDGAFAAATVGGRWGAELLDMATGERLVALELGPGAPAVSAVAWSPALDRVAFGVGGDVLVLEIDRAALAARRLRAHCTLLQAGHRPLVTALGFSHDGTLLASGGTDGRVALFALGAERHVDRLPPDGAPELATVATPAVPELGAHVTIAEGPFAKFGGPVVAVEREARRVTVDVSIFGRRTAVTVTFDQLVVT